MCLPGRRALPALPGVPDHRKQRLEQQWGKGSRQVKSAASCNATCFLQMPSACLCASVRLLSLRGCDSFGRCGSYGLYCVFDGHNGVACAQHSHDLLIEVRPAVCTVLSLITRCITGSELCKKKRHG